MNNGRQMLRNSIWIALGLNLANPVVPAWAAPLRLLTWNAQSFTNSAEAHSSLSARLNSAVLWMRQFDPDVVLVQEVPDRMTAQSMADKWGEGFAMVVCSSVPGVSAGQSGPGQVAILSRLPSPLSWAGAWDEMGGQPVPGGYAFAVLQWSNQWVSVHSVMFPSAPEDELPRAEAMRQLRHQLTLTIDWKTNRPAAHLLGGTLNSHLDPIGPGPAALALDALAGFTSAFEGLATEQTRTLRVRDQKAGATTDFLLTDQGVFLAPATFHWGILSDHACVVADWDLQPALPGPAPPPEPEVVPAQSPRVAPAPALPVAGDQHNQLLGLNLKWWVGGLVIFSLMLWGLILRRTSRRQHPASALVPLRGQPDGPNPRREPLSQEIRPHLLAWLKEKFVGRLLSERREMIRLQNHASDRAHELGQRVDQIQESLVRQIREAEERVRKLERELAQARAENRELIQVNLALAQRQLEEARKRAREPALVRTE